MRCCRINWTKMVEKLNRFPPFLCRYVARDKTGRRGLSNRQIAMKAGLTKSTVDRLARKHTWNGLRIDTIEAFSKACGVDLLHPSRQIDFLKRRKRKHARALPPSQRRYLQKIVQEGRQKVS